MTMRGPTNCIGALVLIALSPSCATRAVSAADDLRSPLHATHPAGAESPVTVALESDPPAPGEPTQAWRAFAAASAGPQGGHHHHGAPVVPAAADAGAGTVRP